ncbi:MAG: SpoIID/LytB domain-containing protein, partial [Desulfotomaculales bacterium]
LEEYLYGTVPAEMPAGWPPEALKAQAVASRSYALAQIKKNSGASPFDLLATQVSQVYRGYDWETPATNRAVDETRGVVLTWRGAPAEAYFHSSSGGFTENSEDVWKNRVDYIRARPDPFDLNDRHYNWQVSYPKEELIKQLASKGYKFKDIFDLAEKERTSTGKRVKRLLVSGLSETGAPVTVEIGNANEVRTALGLKSAFFTLEKELDARQKLVRVTLRGNGSGHGLGMSQYGALGMAGKGYSYQDILKYYYSGITISTGYGGQE